MLENLKYFDGELTNIDSVPADIKKKHPRFSTSPTRSSWMPPPAARSGSISRSPVNLFIQEPDLKVLSHMYRRAWHTGLKTTYYLRSTGASNIEGATTATKKEVRGIAGGAPAAAAPKKEYTAAEKMACSIEAMRRGEECEACQVVL